MFPLRRDSPSSPSAASTGLDATGSRTPETLPPDLNAWFTLTLDDGSRRGNPIIFVPPRVRRDGTEAISDTHILNILARLKPALTHFEETLDPDGRRRIFCINAGQPALVTTLQIDRNNLLQEVAIGMAGPDGVRVSSVYFQARLPSPTAFQNNAPIWRQRMQARLPSPTPFQTDLPVWLQRIHEEGSRARKRTAPSPPEMQQPRQRRLRDETALSHPMPSTPPITPADLVGQSGISLTPDEFSPFGMSFVEQNQDEQQNLPNEQQVLPHELYLPDMTEIGVPEPQRHRDLSPISFQSEISETSEAIETSRQTALNQQTTRLGTVLHPGQPDQTYFSAVTVGGPSLMGGRPPMFYHERQQGNACSQHAVNAMVGGPLLSLHDFAVWEAQQPAAGQSGQPPPSIAIREADMHTYGVLLDTVIGGLAERGILTHSYYSPVVPDAQGNLVLDLQHTQYLDNLDTDRLMLQVDLQTEHANASHYVAFRRDVTNQWILLDSVNEHQQAILPSVYLAQSGANHVAAIWPQSQLEPNLQQAAANNQQYLADYRIALQEAQATPAGDGQTLINQSRVLSWRSAAGPFINWEKLAGQDVSALQYDALTKLVSDYLNYRHPVAESKEAKKARRSLEGRLNAFLYWRRTGRVQPRKGVVIARALEEQQAVANNRQHLADFKTDLREARAMLDGAMLSKEQLAKWSSATSQLFNWAGRHGHDVSALQDDALTDLVSDYLDFRHPIAEGQMASRAQHNMKSRLNPYLNWRRDGVVNVGGGTPLALYLGGV